MICSLATTPSISELDVDQCQTSFGLNRRRTSSGMILSPEIDITVSTTKSTKTGPSDTSELEGFYLLKKDSQRRQTLYKVLTQDESKICQVWMERIETDRKESVVINIVSKTAYKHCGRFIKLNSCFFRHT